MYTELAQKILSYRNRQGELIGMLQELKAKELPVGRITDEADQGQEIPLTAIDPFTFYSCFNRGLTEENRRGILAHFKNKFGLESEVPEDFEGIPIVDARRAWFFPFKRTRKNDDIPSLWDLANAVVGTPPEKLDAKIFERCLQIESVGSAKLTMGLFWLSPHRYVACDKNNRELFKKKGINIDVHNLATYLQLINAVTSKLGNNYPEISRLAWEVTNVEFDITPPQLSRLWDRFHERISGFTDFQNPGVDFHKQELDYKRKALERYREEVGNAQLRKWIEAGEGNRAREEISKRIQSNLVAFQSWRPSIGSSDKQSAVVLKAFLDSAERPYEGPLSLEPIIQATLGQDLKPSWDTLAAILWALRPTDYFPVKIYHYRQLAEELGQPLPQGRPTAESFDTVMNFGRAFRSALEPQKPRDWVDVQSFLWVTCPNSYKIDEKASKQYWAGGFQWGDTSKLKEFVDGNFWQVGWDSEEEKSAAKRTWSNFEQVKIGDEFAIKGLGGRYDLVIHYIGEVLDKTDDGVLSFRKLERPLYKGKAPTGSVTPPWFDTLVPITSDKVIDIIFRGAKPDEPIITPPPSNLSSRGNINLILYGPPGTGKTFQTIDRAVSMIDPGFASERSSDRAALKRRFDDLLLQGRIEFITFHQSYSYEDFVEGIRPVLDADEEGGPPRYECRPGAFKRLSFNALFDCLERSGEAKDLVPFDVLWKALLSKIESDPEAKYPGLSGRTSYQFSVTQKGNIEGINILSDKKFLCSRKILEQVFDARRSKDTISVSDVMEVVARGSHSQLVAAAFNELRRIEKAQFRGKVQPARQEAYTESEKAEIVQRFLAEGKRSGQQLKPESDWNRYVLVVDEINRGNISKILGELITLIEPDKRLRAGDSQNSLIVTLPYSGEKFAVPANLYVVGTMNTADKSIALVDTALRRRFEFEELRVDLSLCTSLSENMRSALTELNRRIVLRKDRDHQIGHAYFINVADDTSFNQCFRKQIIPLLQEYFYNDWEGLRYVLGENHAPPADGQFICKISGANVKEARTKWQWCFDGDVSDINCLQTLCSNYSIV
jgi:hypothetical protein